MNDFFVPKPLSGPYELIGQSADPIVSMLVFRERLFVATTRGVFEYLDGKLVLVPFEDTGEEPTVKT